VKRAAALALALVAAWLLAGCNMALRVAYYNADAFLHSRVASYVPMDGKAANELDERIDAFLAWHRVNALPQYARLTADAARRVAEGLSPEDLVWGYDSMVAQTGESLREASVRIAPMLDRLKPEQIAHMEKRFAEDNRKFARDNLRGSEKLRRDRLAKRTIERLEDWVGKLSKAQTDRVRQYAERAPLADDMRDRERKRVQAEFLAMVRAHEAQKRLPAFVAAWERCRDPALTASNVVLRRETERLLIDLDRTLTGEQRDKAVARLRSFSEDFSTLAAAGGTVHARQ